MDQAFDISPNIRSYVTTLACPEAISNLVYLVLEHIKKPGVADHTNTMFEYPLDYDNVCSRFAYIVDNILEDQGIEWRIHSTHVLVAEEKVRIIMRKVSLLDLTQTHTPLYDYEKRLYAVMRAYCKQYEQDLIPGPSNITAFRIGNNMDEGTGAKGFYWIYTRIFDMWEYSDQYPEAGWRPIE